MKGGLGHAWPMSPFMFTSIDYLKIKRDFRGAGRVQRGVAIAPLWLPSPMRQKAEQWNHGKCSIAVLLNIKSKDLLFAHLRRSTKHVLGQKRVRQKPTKIENGSNLTRLGKFDPLSHLNIDRVIPN